MRLPLSWLRRYVAVEAPARTIADRLVDLGFEVDRIDVLGAPDEGSNHEHFRIGRVVDYDRHPNADRLRLCHVDLGEGEPRQIVCGAANFAAGDTVVVALPGAVLPGADAPLRRARLRGEVSDGMMLSERELHLSNEHDGIMVLRERLEVGSLLRDHVALAEEVIELEVGSNRGDALSVYGLAREVAAGFDLELRPPPGEEPEATGAGRVEDVVRVGIEAPDRCYRFTARAFSDVVIAPSPLRLRAHLAAAGMRPISNVVDVTNYVMLGLGNPLHAYDAVKIPGRVLTARMARRGEALRTLDGRERRLDQDMLVIADAEGPSGIAGIMGSARSEIGDDTSTVVIEAANFERAGILRTSRRLALRTEGSNRWEKGVDPHLAGQASRWAAELMVHAAGARQVPGTLDEVARLPERERITLRPARTDALLGVAIPEETQGEILARLGYEPTRAGGGIEVRVPTWRWLDTTREIDLVEEVGRVHGLHHLPATLPLQRTAGGFTREQALRRRVEEDLAGLGLQEAQTITLVEAGEPERYGLAPEDPRRDTVRLANPLTADHAELRTSLVPSLLAAVRRNRAVGHGDVALFELSRTYHPRRGQMLPDEPLRLALVLTGRLGGAGWHGSGPPIDVFVVKGVLEVLFARLGVEVGVEQVVRGHLHPGRGARLLLGDREIGELGELHPDVAARFGVEGRVGVAELDLAALLAAVPERRSAGTVPELPPVLQDVAVVVPDTVRSADVLAVARAEGGPLLRDAAVFDVFRDAERLGAGRTSLAIRLTFRADDRTLTEDEASEVRLRIVAALAGRFGAELRGG